MTTNIVEVYFYNVDNTCLIKSVNLIFVFVNNYSENYQCENYEAKLMAERLNKYYTRLKNAKIINNYEIKRGLNLKIFLKMNS